MVRGGHRMSRNIHMSKNIVASPNSKTKQNAYGHDMTRFLAFDTNPKRHLDGTKNAYTTPTLHRFQGCQYRVHVPDVKNKCQVATLVEKTMNECRELIVVEPPPPPPMNFNKKIMKLVDPDSGNGSPRYSRPTRVGLVKRSTDFDRRRSGLG